MRTINEKIKILKGLKMNKKNLHEPKLRRHQLTGTKIRKMNLQELKMKKTNLQGPKTYQSHMCTSIYRTIRL